jgi:phenylpropionate dioxygenase-like ring-hydroxylating dioxygenase large terminal subunit
MSASPSTNARLPLHTGPGTPGGELLRRYWQPVMLLDNFPPGSDPAPIRIMGEDLVLFRDGSGSIGLLDRHCAHRCADLSYGRVENGGLRCVYHGWLFDVNGKCLEQPGEPGKGQHRDRIQQRAYPCVEKAGAIWAYMGPGEPPLFPNYPALAAPDAYRFTARWLSHCNYLQANEGNVDPVHTSFLHGLRIPDGPEGDPLRKARAQEVFGSDVAPRLSVQETRFGLRVIAERRQPAEDRRLVRVTNFVMPNACAIGGAETPFGRGGSSMFWHVPIDDTSHWRFEFVFHSKNPLPRAKMREAYRLEADENGVPWRNAGNRFGQQRDELDRSYLGMGATFPVHDLFVTESQGQVHERDNEHLVSSDIAIVRTRRQLMQAMQAVAEGRDPPGVLRDTAANRFDDLLVLTESIAAGTPMDAFLAEMEAARIYELDPAVASTDN